MTAAIIGGLLLLLGFIDAVLRTHEQQNAVLRAALADIDARRQK